MQVEYIDHMGTDLTIVNAARVSFDKESEWDFNEEYFGDGEYELYPVLKESDAKLIRYLSTHGHFTPFTHATITLRETVPIFVARQRFKHTVGFSYNEVSRRYVDSDPEFFIPEVWRGRPEGSVKQGSSDTVVKEPQIVLNYENINGYPPVFGYKEICDLCEQWYKLAIESGIAPEQARMVLPQSMYTSYYVTGSLSAWARAYKLRIDSHAQKEIQDLAKEWDKIIRPLFPVSWDTLVGTEFLKATELPNA